MTHLVLVVVSIVAVSCKASIDGKVGRTTDDQDTEDADGDEGVDAATSPASSTSPANDGEDGESEGNDGGDDVDDGDDSDAGVNGGEPTLSLTGVTPTQHNAVGGVLTVAGTNIDPAVAVTAGGKTCEAPLTVMDQTSVSCTLPPGLPAGALDVTVTWPNAETRSLVASLQVSSLLSVASMTSPYETYVYGIDSSTGALSLGTASPYSGSASRIVFLGPNNRLYLINNSGTNYVRIYDITYPTLELTQSGPQYTFAGCAGARGARLHPNNRWVYLACPGDDSVLGIDIDPTNGTVTTLPGTPNAAGDFTRGACIPPDGKHLYATNYLASNLSSYSIDQASGELEALSTPVYATGTGPYNCSATNENVYTANHGAGTVTVFARDPATGALTVLETQAAKTGSYMATLTPDAKFLFVPSETQNNISIFEAAADGSLTEIATSPLAVGASVRAVAIESSGKYLYAAGSGALIYAYEIAADGSLSSLTPATYTFLGEAYWIDTQ